MNKRMITTSAAAILALAAVAPAQADEGLSVSGDIGVYSQYVWRGVPQTSGATAVQGDAVVGITDELSLTGWFSNAYSGASSNSGTSTVDEFDWVLDYSSEAGGIGYSVGAIYYTYLYDSASNFAEVYVGASLDAPLAPSLTVYYTAGESGSKFYKSGDLWVDLGFSQTVGTYDLGLTVSYANLDSDTTAAGGNGGSGFKVATLSASKDVAAGDTTFTPSLTVTYPLVSNTKTIYGATADMQVIAGVSMGF